MNFEKRGPEKKVGFVKEQAYKITKKEGNITINDIKNIKKKWIEDGKKKNKEVRIDMIKVLSGSWVTFTSEEKFNEYFDSHVKDPSKFFEFPQVEFFVQYE